MVRKIKNSRKAGLSRAEITRRLQDKGYKLEYIDIMMKKAEMGKKIIIFGVLFLLIGGLIAGYLMFFQKGEKLDLKNPLEDFNVLFSKSNSTQDVESESSQIVGNQTENTKQDINIEDIEITSEFLTYILNELGGYNLRKHPLTGEKAVVGFDISGEKFYSVMDGGIETYEGDSDGKDLIIYSTKEAVVMALLDDEPVETFKSSIGSGDTSFEIIAGETELFAKGYMPLYNSLKE